MRSLVLAFLFLISLGNTVAQIERVLPRRNTSAFEDTRFVVGFMQNEIFIPGAVEPPSDGLVLQIFIASDYDATVAFEFPGGNVNRVNVKANTVHIENVDPNLMMHDNERPRKNAVFVTSDVPVVCYAINTFVASTDSYIAIPLKHLGTDYRAVTRSNDFYTPIQNSSPGQKQIDTTVRQAEFMVIAIEDNTTVSYTPSYTTEGGVLAGQTVSVTLNKGECYLVKSVQETRGVGDLTGSHVTSTKPVAMLSGHCRVSVPLSSGRTSKDHLVEMVPPINLWGKDFATAPFDGIDSGDHIRIVASEDSTVVSYTNAASSGTRLLVKAGDWVEYPDVRFPTHWVTSKPTLVAQFMKSQVFTGTRYADPAMVVIPPIQYYSTRALFQFPSFQPSVTIGPTQQFFYFINVICEDVSVPSIRVDGVPVTTRDPGLNTQTVPGTNLHWSQLPLPKGTHVIEADTGTFTCVMYATTDVDSYANMVCMSFDTLKRIDISAPNYHLGVKCGRVVGTVRDTIRDTVYAASLQELIVIRDKTRNYSWDVTGPLDTIGTMSVEATVMDLWKDAIITIHAWDKSGNGKEWEYIYTAPKLSVSPPVKFAGEQGERCSTIVVKNLDTNELVIPRIRLVGDKRYSLQNPPQDTIRIRPKDSLTIVVCCTYDGSRKSAYGSVYVELLCDMRKEIPLTMTPLASIIGSSVDFGSIRIGDTSCLRVKVVNNGPVNVVLDSIALAAAVPEFTVDVSGLNLPISFASGDSMWVTVCYTPTKEAISTRTDTADGTPSVRAFLNYRGRGIRPRIPDVLIDFGKHRIGTRADTTFDMRNLGEADAILHAITDIGDTSEFNVAPLHAASIPVAGRSSVSIAAAYLPDTLGPSSMTTALGVDWRYHDTVHAVFRGVGIVPAIDVRDIDLGTIFITDTKDSICRIYLSNGTEGLTVDNVVVGGPDAASFSFGPTVLAPRLLPIGDSIADHIIFRPSRSGRHTCWLDITNDAAPAYARVRARVNITALVVVGDTISAEGQIIAQSTLPTCQESRQVVRFTNTGNVAVSINSVTFTLDNGVVTPLDTVTFPVRVEPDSTFLYHVDVSVEASSTGSERVVFNYNDSLQLELRHQYNVTMHPSRVSTTGSTSATPGEIVHVTLRCEVPDSLNTDLPLTVALSYDSERFDLQPGVVNGTIVEGGRQGSVDAIIVDNGRGMTLTTTRSLRTPYVASWDIPVGILWKDASISTIHAQMSGTMCTTMDTDSLPIGVVLCASNLRAIRFGSIPVIDVSVAPMPAHSEIILALHASLATTVSVHLVDASGTTISLGQNLSLKKGTQYLNFPCSGLATGWYQVVVKGMSGNLVVPVIIVN